MGRTSRVVLFYFCLAFGVMATCNATTYFVGDTSGWDISTNLDSWASDKQFQVGDVLVFQYSSSYSVYEVTKPNYDTCNTTNALQQYSSGNTTVTLSKPGEKYFVVGNRLYCLAGMKLHVHVDGDISPTPSPTSQPAGFPKPSSKKNDPPGQIPTSNASTFRGRTSLEVAATLVVLASVTAFRSAMGD